MVEDPKNGLLKFALVMSGIGKSRPFHCPKLSVLLFTNINLKELNMTYGEHKANTGPNPLYFGPFSTENLKLHSSRETRKNSPGIRTTSLVLENTVLSDI